MIPVSQWGYADVLDEMAAHDGVGPLARAAFNNAPREISARCIVQTYKAGRQIDLLNPKKDAAFAAWIAREYRKETGGNIDDIIVPRRVIHPLARCRRG